MKILGRVILSKTEGRKDAWVKKQVENDYFLALQIYRIDETDVATTADLFSALQKILPLFSIDGKNCTPLFGKVSLPVGAKDVPHLTLGNFPDFRIDRSVSSDIDKDKITKAIDLEQQTVSIELSAEDFEMVIATKNPELVAGVKDHSLIQSAASVVTAPTVGVGRDAILNFKPSTVYQTTLADLSKQVFGKEFVLWNSLNQAIPYHITLAQSNQLTSQLDRATAMKQEKSSELTPAVATVKF
jgi:hypothetical protein